MRLAEKVKMRREELGLSQEELANMMGYKSRTSINKIECGRPVSQKIIVRLAEVLKVSVAYLMGWEDDSEENAEPKKSTNNSELSENKRKLIEFVETVPDDKTELMLRVLRSIVEDEE